MIDILLVVGGSLWTAFVWVLVSKKEKKLVVKSDTEAITSVTIRSMPTETPVNPDSISYLWDSPQHNYHNARVLCDKAGLSVEQKNILSACIYQESRFNNEAINHNKDSSGKTLSTDYGICQINDYYHIAPTGTPFLSVQDVVDNPDKAVSYMITMYQHGLLKQWVSYSSGAYSQWLSQGSPMWGLAAV